MANTFRLTAELGIIAIGVTLLMIAGEFDLAVGSVFGLAAGVAIVLFNNGLPGPLAVVVTSPALPPMDKTEPF
jgi:simple sugar transport system permease protein